MTEIIFLAKEAPEGGYNARALGASIFAEADSLAELHEQVRDAVRCHFGETERPKIIRRVIRRIKEESAGQLDLSTRATPENLGLRVTYALGANTGPAGAALSVRPLSNWLLYISA